MSEEKSVNKKSMKRVLIMGAVALIFIVGVIPQIKKNRISDEAVRVIELNQLTPIEKVGDYSYVYEQQDWVVERQDGTIDTIGVCQSKSSVIIDITIPEKKAIFGKIPGL